MRKSGDYTLQSVQGLMYVCCIIKVQKVAKQNWRKLHLHFGESCRSSQERVCAYW